MTKFFRLLMQLWLMIGFGVIAASATHYVRATDTSATGDVTQLAFSVPTLQQEITLNLWQYTLAILILGAGLTCIHFGFDAFRKSLIIRRLNKELQTRPYGDNSRLRAPESRSHSYSTSLDDASAEN